MRSLLIFTLLLVLVAGCGLPQPARYPQVSSIPAGQQIILEATPFDDPERYGFYLLDPTTAALSMWQFQGGRGIAEGGRICWNKRDQQHWDQARREIVYSGSLGCTGGLYHISADGVVTEVPVPALPRGVTAAHQPISAPSGQLLALIVTVKGSADATTQQIYVAGLDGNWTAYGEDLGLEEIVALRWSPDGRTLAFIGGFHSGAPFYRRIFRLNLERGEVRALSEQEVLVGDVPTFTPQGEVLFGATTAAGEEALYLAKADADAVPVIEQRLHPAGSLDVYRRLLSPDGRFAAISGRRDPLTGAHTIYSVELATGQWRDLLPVAIPDERSGEIPTDTPLFLPLAWAPDAERLLVVSDQAGSCSRHIMTGNINCSWQLYLLPATGGPLERLGSTAYKEVGWVSWVE
jgi:hypothetical protein